MFCLLVSKCTIRGPGAHRNQKMALVPLKLELRMVEGLPVVLETEANSSAGVTSALHYGVISGAL